jgi:hypothetical protein
MVSDRFLEVRSTLENHCATKGKGLQRVKRGSQNVEYEGSWNKDKSNQILQSKSD